MSVREVKRVGVRHMQKMTDDCGGGVLYMSVLEALHVGVISVRREVGKS